MPNYDFKCKMCGKIIEKNMLFAEAEKGIKCPKCDDTMERQFTPCGNLKCGWNVPYKPGHNAQEDRKRAFISQERQGKLPKDINEHNANFADLM